MKIVRIFNSTKGNLVCEECVVADNFWTRGKGLLGRKELPEDEGILLSPGSSIHMFGMKFAIDVVFLTKDDIVTDMVENIAPGKAHIAKDGGSGKPFAALELSAGKIQQVGVSIGDQLKRE
jgi:uncharacterized membrane protein (UPF0127 family)